MVLVGELFDNKVKVEYQEIDGKQILVSPHSTLGADDGFGVALILEIIEKRDQFKHGPLELILTSDEEKGLVGVRKLPSKNSKNSSPISPFEFRYLINMDALSGDKVYIGSAGGTLFNFSLGFSPIDAKPEKSYITLSVENLTGGHSGGAIHFGRGNAIKWIVSILLSQSIEFSLCKLTGGTALNAIPTNCEAVVSVISSDSKQFVENCKAKYNEICSQFKNIETNPKFMVQEIDFQPDFLIDPYETRKILSFLSLIKHGPIRMHPEFTAIVDTSQCLSLVSISGSNINVCVFSRSNTSYQLKIIDEEMKSLMFLYGESLKCSIADAGTPWEPKLGSELASKMIKSFENQNSILLEEGLLHVTIEPAQFKQLGYTDAEMIAVCPSIPKAHCIGEFMDINEAIRWRNAIIHLLSQVSD